MSFPPDPHGHAPLIAQPLPRRIGAPFGQLLRHSEAAPECASCAKPPGHVEKHNSVRALKPEIERLGVVTVRDPRVAVENAALLLAPLDLRGCNPAGLPEVQVEMNDRQPSLGSERERESAFPRTGQPSDYDAPPYRQRASLSSLSTARNLSLRG